MNTARFPGTAVTRPALVLGVLAVGALAALAGPSDHVRALPPAGTDAFLATGQVAIESRLGAETIDLAGNLTVERSDPFMGGGVEVVALEITSMDLTGQSAVGAIVVSESAGATSIGEIRSLQPPPDEFPATSFFDSFVAVSAATSPETALANSSPIHMTPATDLASWPPIQLKYQSDPLQGVDNDGDTVADEDTSDEDGDHLYDEDPLDGIDNDTDAGFPNPDPAFIDEDPPLSQCTLALCDADGDTLIDEDPACTPLFPTLPIGACVVSISLTLFGDTDGDGCANVAEDQTAAGSEFSGGLRDSGDIWDFMDVPTGSLLERDRIVSGADIAGVVSRFGATDAGPGTFDRNSDPLSTPIPVTGNLREDYHPAYDRGGSDPLRNTWNLLPPDGAISGGDIAAVVAQFGHSCLTPV